MSLGDRFVGKEWKSNGYAREAEGTLCAIGMWFSVVWLEIDEAYRTKDMMTLKDEFTAVEDDERYKAIADKFLEKYESICARESASRRRWIWELIQNAKDARKCDGLIVEVRLHANGLSFRHNGDPFSPRQLSGLFKQVSDKPSDGGETGLTGKYGSGFITTYLLSPVIHVDGVLRPARGALRRFRIVLNRNAKSSEEMVPLLREGWSQILHDSDNDSAFVPLTNYDDARRDTDLDTGFFYPLSKAFSEEVSADLKGLHETVPFVLIFNPKIRRIKWICEFSNAFCSYELTGSEPWGSYRLSKILVSTNGGQYERTFIVATADGMALCVEVGLGNELSLMAPGQSSPTLYRDLPLIGSDALRLPFVVNGGSMFPQERRDSVFLSSKQEKGLRNREYIQSAVVASAKLVAWLAAQHAKNLRIAAQLYCDDANWEPDVRAWFQETIIKPYRASLLDLPIVEADAGYIALKNTWIPDPMVDGIEGAESTFWEIGVAFHGGTTFSLRDHWRDWYRSMKLLETNGTWNDIPMVYTIPRLLEDISKAGELSALGFVSQNGEPDESAALGWLNRVFAMAIQAGCRAELDLYCVVPDMLGKFHGYKALYAEPSPSGIPNSLLDILALLGKPWKSELIHRGVLEIDSAHQHRTISEVSEVVAKVLNEMEFKGIEKHPKFLSRENALRICLKLLCFEGRDAERNQLQQYLVVAARWLFKMADPVEPPLLLEEFDAEPALHHTMRLINRKLETDIRSLDTLAAWSDERLDDCCTWMNSYIKTLAESGLGHLSNQKIVPNRCGDFCKLEDLYDAGTSEAPLNPELLKILALLNPQKDWNPILIADQIGISCGKAKTLSELAREVQEELSAAIEKKSTIDEIREGLLEVSRWYNNNPKEASRLIQGINTLVNNVFFLLAMQDKSNSDNVLSILRKPEKFASLAKLADAEIPREKIEDLVNAACCGSGILDDAPFGSYSLGNQLIQLFGNADGKEIVQAITSGHLRIDRLREMLLTFPNGLPDWALEMAENEREEYENLWSKLRVGEEVERSLLPILQQSLPSLRCTYKWRGPFDFFIVSDGSERIFKLEVKSVKHGNTAHVKLSKNQGREAVRSGAGYGLAVIERLPEDAKLSGAYLKTALMFLETPGECLRSCVELYDQMEAAVVNQGGDVQLALRLPEPKFGIRYDYVREHAKGFDDLVAAVETFFGVP